MLRGEFKIPTPVHTGNKLPLSHFPPYEEMMLDVMCEIADPDDKLRLIVE